MGILCGMEPQSPISPTAEKTTFCQYFILDIGTWQMSELQKIHNISRDHNLYNFTTFLTMLLTFAEEWDFRPRNSVYILVLTWFLIKDVACFES